MDPWDCPHQRIVGRCLEKTHQRSVDRIGGGTVLQLYTTPHGDSLSVDERDFHAWPLRRADQFDTGGRDPWQCDSKVAVAKQRARHQCDDGVAVFGVAASVRWDGLSDLVFR